MKRRLKPPRSVASAPRGKRRWLLLALSLLAAGVVLYLARTPLLAQMGSLLIVSDPLEKADAAVVLSGDESYEGNRLRVAIQLYRQGWVRKLVLSGARRGYGVYETDFSVPLAISLGVSRWDILPIANSARSTQQEAELIAPLLERRGVRSFYIVTTNFHTRRGKQLFIRASGGRMRVLAYPAADQFFNADRWWESREGRKFFLLECMKQLNSLLE